MCEEGGSFCAPGGVQELVQVLGVAAAQPHHLALGSVHLGQRVPHRELHVLADRRAAGRARFKLEQAPVFRVVHEPRRAELLPYPAAPARNVKRLPGAKDSRTVSHHSHEQPLAPGPSSDGHFLASSSHIAAVFGDSCVSRPYSVLFSLKSVSASVLR